MRARSIAAAVVFALAAAASTPRVALAQDDPTTVEARARFHEGVALFDKQSYDAAHAKFTQAYALKPLPDILYNMAWASLKGGHYVEAEKEFTKVLKERDLDPGERTDCTKALVDVKNKNGHIAVDAAAGTDVVVDNDHIGTAPISETVPVEPGAHVVKFTGGDGQTQSMSVSVLAGQTQTARFGGGGSGAAPPPPGGTATPPPASSGSSAPPSDSAPASSTSGSTEPPASNAESTQPTGVEVSTSKPGLLAPPSNLVPVFLGGGVAVAGFAVAIIVGVAAKSSAQHNADSVEAQINAQFPGGKAPSGTCTNPSARFANACSALKSDIDNVNTDATIGNIGLGVGIAATAFTVGYWLFATKHDAAEPATGVRVQPAPMLGYREGGMALVGSF